MATDEHPDDLVELVRALMTEQSPEAGADLAKLRALLQRGRRRRAERAVKARMVELVQVLASIYEEIATATSSDQVRDVLRGEFKVHDIDHLCLGREVIKEWGGPVEAARERIGLFGIELVRADVEAGLFEDPEAVQALLSSKEDTRHPNSLLAWAKKIEVNQTLGEIAEVRSFGALTTWGSRTQ